MLTSWDPLWRSHHLVRPLDDGIENQCVASPEGAIAHRTERDARVVSSTEMRVEAA
jgi:hypothetical protein